MVINFSAPFNFGVFFKSPLYVSIWPVRFVYTFRKRIENVAVDIIHYVLSSLKIFKQKKSQSNLSADHMKKMVVSFIKFLVLSNRSLYPIYYNFMLFNNMCPFFCRYRSHIWHSFLKLWDDGTLVESRKI